jgi:hypothetical protein
MPIKLTKNDTAFRNPLVFASDAKAVKMDNVLTNLFVLLTHNGQRPKQRLRSANKGDLDLTELHSKLTTLEAQEKISGFIEHNDASEAWLRSNLVNMVNRGKPDKEKLSSLRPIHLLSYRLRNPKQSTDYASADQVYLMLDQRPQVKEKLKEFLAEGWDESTGKIEDSETLDVDSVGILQLIQTISKRDDKQHSSTGINRIRPILPQQAELFCEDITRLLAYKKSIPRSVLLDYIKTVISFHLSLYLQTLVHVLPQMVKAGTSNIPINRSWVVDLTGNLDSRISEIAIRDAEHTYNSIYNYVKASYQINAVLGKIGADFTDSDRLDEALQVLAIPPADFETYFQFKWNQHWQSSDADEKELMNGFLQYEPSNFDRYLELILMKTGKLRHMRHVDLMDNLSFKNNERGFMAQGRSKKHPRRYVMGTRLLEALTQILLVEPDNNQFVTRAISIEALMEKLRSRYGLIINGLGEERFSQSDVNTNLAFHENVEAFKNKLRQIGFYNDLSDAYILQKVRPRYEAQS